MIFLMIGRIVKTIGGRYRNLAKGGFLMRKCCTILLLSLVLLSAAMMPVLAARPVERIHARHVVNRTALVIIAAQKAARTGHEYLGLGRSVAHQRFARQLFREGFYFRAIIHSLRARTLAVNVIRRNKAELIKEATLDKIESSYAQKSPPDQELDQQVEKDTEKDDSAVDINIDVDIDI
jgi:hypothetical protein